MRFLIALALVFTFSNAKNIEKSFNKLSTVEMAKVLAAMVGGVLPKRLDEITVAKETFYEGSTYGLKKFIIPKDAKVRKDFKPYLVVKLYEKQSFYDYMKKSEVKNMCKSNLVRLFLNKGGKVRVDYYNEEEENILFIYLNKEDCK